MEMVVGCWRNRIKTLLGVCWWPATFGSELGSQCQSLMLFALSHPLVCVCVCVTCHIVSDGSQRTTPRSHFSVLEEPQCLGRSHLVEKVAFKALPVPVTLSLHQDVPSAFSSLNKWTNRGLDGYGGCWLCKIPEFTNEIQELVGASLQTAIASVHSFSDV